MANTRDKTKQTSNSQPQKTPARRTAPLASIVWRFGQVFLVTGAVPGVWIAWTTRGYALEISALRAAQVYLFLYLLLPVILFTLGSLVFDQPRARILARPFVIRVLIWSGAIGGVATIAAFLVALVALGTFFGGENPGVILQALTVAIGWLNYVGLELVMLISGLLAGIWFGRGRAR